jgi:hypothetical protein
MPVSREAGAGIAPNGSVLSRRRGWWMRATTGPPARAVSRGAGVPTSQDAKVRRRNSAARGAAARGRRCIGDRPARVVNRAAVADLGHRHAGLGELARVGLALVASRVVRLRAGPCARVTFASVLTPDRSSLKSRLERLTAGTACGRRTRCARLVGSARRASRSPWRSLE